MQSVVDDVFVIDPSFAYPGSEVPVQRKQRKGPSGRTQRSFSNDRTNQIIAFHWWNLGLIGKSDEHRTQTTLKRAGCFDDKKYFALCNFGQSSSYLDSV